MAILPYVSSIINVANGFSHATRPKYVGQISNLIQEYKNTHESHSIEGWIDFYNSKLGEERVHLAANKIWDSIEKIKENLESLNYDDVFEWTKDLIYTKSYMGFSIQIQILEMSCKESFRLSTPEEESQNIDGYVDGEPVSIKPITWKKNPQYKINHRIIYYKETKKGIKIIDE